MNLYEYYMQFANSKQEHDRLFKEVIDYINPTITKELNSIASIIKDDIRQEILIKIFKIFINQRLTFISIEETKRLLKENNYLLSNFIKDLKGNKLSISSSIYPPEIDSIFINTFHTYVCNLMLISYIKKTIRNKLDCMKKYYRYKYISLNIIKEDTELLELISDDKKPNKLSNDHQFLKLFISDNTILTQKEVAVKLNVSQQYISKRLSQITKKIKKI